MLLSGNLDWEINLTFYYLTYISFIIDNGRGQRLGFKGLVWCSGLKFIFNE